MRAIISRLVSLARQAGQEVGAALQRYGGVSKICGKHEVDALADRPLDQYCALCEIAAARLAGRIEQAERYIVLWCEPDGPDHVKVPKWLYEELARLRKEAAGDS